MINHNRIQRRLLIKGWDDHLIKKTLRSFKKANKLKHPFIIFFDKLLFWIGLFVVIVGNFFLSIGVIPIIITMPRFMSIIICVFLGLCFGLLMDIFIRDIDYLSSKHYIVAGILIPLVGIINMFYVYEYVQSTSIYFKLIIQNNLFILGIIYFLCFISPHIVYKVIEEIKKKESLLQNARKNTS